MQQKPTIVDFQAEITYKFTPVSANLRCQNHLIHALCRVLTDCLVVKKRATISNETVMCRKTCWRCK